MMLSLFKSSPDYWAHALQYQKQKNGRTYIVVFILGYIQKSHGDKSGK